jgi:hypothetical protein
MARIKPTVTSAKTTASLVAASLSEDGTLGSRIDSLCDLREQKRELEGELKVVEESYTKLADELMETLDAQGMAKATGKTATVSVSSSVVGQIENDAAFFAYVKKSGHFHLFQRRLSDAAVREILEQKGSIPGIKPFTKKRLNLRTL